LAELLLEENVLPPPVAPLVTEANELVAIFYNHLKTRERSLMKNSSFIHSSFIIFL